MRHSPIDPGFSDTATVAMRLRKIDRSHIIHQTGKNQGTCTGGGTVLHGPGCFNYSLVLRADERNLQSITATTRLVMATPRAAL